MDTKERRRRSSAGSKSSASTHGRTTQNRRSGTPQQKRTVRPPREEIPEVVYTMPKPFNRGSFLLKLISVAAVVVALVMCMSLFFRVDTILVAGAEVYSPWEIREASGIEEGDSLLGMSRGGVAGRIKSKLPYVDEVKVTISMPGTVQIDITELDVAYAIEASDGSWWLVSAEGRVIENVGAGDALGYTRVLGVQIEAPAVNGTAQAAQQPEESTEDDGWNTAGEVSAAERLKVALSMLECLEDNGIIGDILSVDVSSTGSLTMNYEDRITVILGDSEQLSYKISYMAAALEQLESYQSGELDVSFRYSDQALLTTGSE